MKLASMLWFFVLGAVTAVLVFPGPRTVFIAQTASHPYLMGFIKFAIMATLGELAAVRIVTGAWKRPPALPLKTLVWGLIGMLIVVMFQVYTAGVNGAVAAGYIPLGSGTLSTILQAIITSTVMNLTFSPAFMAAHRISDTYLDLRAASAVPRLSGVVAGIDWLTFIQFVVFKTIPFFWIPAHTITFLLPGAFRVVYAAYLSIALGAILAYARRKAASAEVPVPGQEPA